MTTADGITCTPPIRNPLYLDGKMPWGDERDAERTCLEMFLEHAARTPDAPCLGGRHHEKQEEGKDDDKEGAATAAGKGRKMEDQFRWQSYAATRDRVLATALGLQALLGVERGARVAVFSPCSVRCFEMSLVASALCGALVPVNENSSPEGVRTVVRNSGAVAAVVAAPEDSETVRTFDELLPGRVVLVKARRGTSRRTLADVVRAGRATPAYRAFAAAVASALADDEKAKANGEEQEELPPLPPLDVVTPAEAEARAARGEQRRCGARAVARVLEAWPLARPGMDDLCIVMYTSGTTGTPKGVMLTQANLTAGVAGFHSSVGTRLWGRQRWVYFNMLPLAHIYGLAVAYVFVRLGGSVAFFSGDRRALLAEMQMVRPTVIAAVPRVYQKLYEGVLARVAALPWLQRTAFWAAYAWRRARLAAGGYYTYADGVFAPVRAQFGGEVAIALNGGAPIPRDVCEFFHVALTHEFYDGYGMTETTAAGIRSQSAAPLTELGLLTPFYNTEMRVLSVPEMGYLATDTPPRGELLIRGPQVALRGYHGDPAATARAFDAEGFVHTGDVVALVAPAQVRIIDRRKNMFKLAQGEYVSGEAIEGVLLQSPYIASVFVHGDSTQPYPVAVVVPDRAALCAWVPAHAPQLAQAAAARDMRALCASAAVRDLVLAEITRLSRAAGLKGYEFVHHVHLHDTPFDEARGLVSSSLKLKRHALREYFANELAQLASENH